MAKKAQKVLVLRTCAADGTSYNDFKWPKKGAAKCSDWKATPTCGNGLHGLLWGEGEGSLLSWASDARWLVVEVLESDIVAIDSQKVKFPKGVVVHCGNQDSATKFILSDPRSAGKKVTGATASNKGYGGTATAGCRGCIAILYWSGEKYRRACFEVGENGIKPNTKYRCDEKGKLVEVSA